MDGRSKPFPFASERPRMENIDMIKARQVDEKRRITLPADFPPGTDVVIEKVDRNTLLLKRQGSETQMRIVALPVVEHLPDDPEWDKVEEAFGRAAYKNLPPPEED